MNDEAVFIRKKKYSSVKAGLALAGFLLSALSPFFFRIFLSDHVFTFLEGLSLQPEFVLASYASIFFIFIGIVFFPLALVSSFFTERKFGLSQRSFFSWLYDEIKSSSLNFVFSLAAILIFYAMVLYFPGTWWLISAFLWSLFTVFMAFVAPVILIPLFLKYLPIDNDEVSSRLFALAHKAGVKIGDIRRVDLSRKTMKANAALVGLGRTRKVILADTLTDNFTSDEVLTVAAHEFAHHKFFHIPKLLVFSILKSSLGLFILFHFSGTISVLSGADGIHDIRTLPVIFFFICVFETLLLPLGNFLSRCLEREADSFALTITARPEVFISAMEKLSAMNLSDDHPGTLKKIFLYTHPPIGERIASANKFGEDPV